MKSFFKPKPPDQQSPTNQPLPKQEAQSHQTSQATSGMTTNIQELRELKLFIEGGSLKVALFGLPSSANDHWICNLPFDQVFSRYPNTLPMEQRIKASTANNQVTMLENLADCIADGDPTTEDLSLDDDSMTSETTDKLIDEGEASDS
ncbi:MAG: hypothetical protein AB8B36_12420, partial [Prochlorococcus sp.]